MAERWRRVVGLDAYEVSDHGRVRSLVNTNNNARAAPLLLKPTVNRQGYERVSLRLKRRQRHRFVQHLVLEAFVGPRPPGMECRHLDGAPGNNQLSNLAWGTKQANMADQRRHGTLAAGSRHYARVRPERLARGSAHGCAKLTEAQVDEIRRASESFGQLAKRFDVARSTIARAATGKRWKHVG
jgi:hypothetical protein